MLKKSYILLLFAVLSCAVSYGQRKGGGQPKAETKKVIAFPASQPVDANVNKPYDGARLNVSPPGFCWWRAGDYGEVEYRLFVYDAKGKEFFASEKVLDPIYIPSKVFPEGEYTWTVAAYLPGTDTEVAKRQTWGFSIENGAYPLPLPEMGELLSRIPATHPKLIFNREDMSSLKQKLEGKNKEQYGLILAKAEKGLNLPVLKDPVFHLITDRKEFAQKRTDYRVEYHSFGNLYLDAVEPMAFVYMVTGEKKYGEEAKKHMLRLTELPIGGALEIYDSKFDEITLQIADALPRAYDWAYDAFSSSERDVMENWMVSLADSLLMRMSGPKRDFYYYSGESHDGRVPPYLINFAMVLSHRPEAVRWLEFGIKACLSVYPQWGTEDGGWAEGVSYALTYSGRFIPPIEALYRNTGFDIWQRPFYKNFPYFLTYGLSPIGEITPFGDSEDSSVRGTKAALINSMLRFYAERNNDPEMKWWVDLFQYDKEDVDRSMKGLIQDIMIDDVVIARKPEVISQDRVFPGIGWFVMHTDITEPRQDLMYIFKSSPFGADSHSHLDQNSFAIMKGGKALAIPAGSRYPQHGSPFHTRYTRQTLAHNTILVNGKGQVDKDPSANGSIFDHAFGKNLSYAAGEAHSAYGGSVKKFDRYTVMIRPSVIFVLDDIQLAESGSVEWLLHGKEEFGIDTKNQRITSVRNGERMQVQMLTASPLKISQDDSWPMDPKEGYPMVKTKNPANQWHLTAATQQDVSSIRIGALMTFDDVKFESRNEGDTRIIVISFPDGAKSVLNISLSGESLLSAKYTPASGEEETIEIKPRKL